MGLKKFSCADSVDTVFNLLATDGLLLVQDTRVANVVHMLTGESLRTSWWTHAKAHLIFAVLEALKDHPKVLFTKMMYGKDTLVHASLWPAVLAVACERAAWQLRGLSPEAVNLLHRIDSQTIPLQAKGSAVMELEKRLLCAAREIHTASGRHEMQMETWQAWSASKNCQPLPSIASARQFLEQAVAHLGASSAALPWCVDRVPN